MSLATLPLGILALAALGSMLASTMAVKTRHLLLGGSAIAFVAAAVAASQVNVRAELFGRALVLDAYSALAAIVVSLCGGAVLLISLDSKSDDRHAGEYVALVLFAVLGAALMASTEDFVAFFLALQLSSIPLYVLSGFDVKDRLATEASVKFLLLGMVASVIMLYGFSVIFTQAGSSAFAAMGGGDGELVPAVVVGLVFVLLGFAFKMGAAPMHFWIPDTYQGSAVPITALLSTVPKLGAVAGLARFASLALTGPTHQWGLGLFALLAVASMALGNLIALVQTDIKRLLAYSSIAHVGYLLVAFASGVTEETVSVALFYIVVYVLTNIGAFAVVSAIAGDRHDLPLDSLAGLWKRAPMQAAVLVVLVLSMLGLPPTPGFWAKFGIVRAAIGAGQGWLAAIVVIASIVSVVYYIRIITQVFIAPATEESLEVGHPTRFVTAAALAVAALIGVWPAGLTQLVTIAARAGSGGG